MKRRLFVPLLLLGAAPALQAQTTTFSSYVAADGGVSGVPVLVGITVGRESSHLGMRLSTGVDAISTFGGSDPAAPDARSVLLTSELDALLFPFGSSSRFPFNPYAFGGVGMRMTGDSYGSTPLGLWSYGGGVRAPISQRLSFEGEMRNRHPMYGDPQAMPHGTSPGWELRAGMTVRIGRTGDAGARRPSGPLRYTMTAEMMRGPNAGAGSGFGTAASSSASARHAVAYRAIGRAEDFLGVRYRWGGNTPSEGFDCSGFVRYVFAGQGIDLPRVSRDQARVGQAVPLELSAFEPGDLIAFASNGRTVDHIAIYAGNNMIIHSSSSGGGVRYDDLSSARGSWYRRHMVAARRFIR